MSLRVAFHAINGVGLGHLVRATCLAKEVLALVPGSRVLVLTNARDTTMLEHAGLDFVKFPPRVGEPHADPLRVESAFGEREEEATQAATLDAFEPDLVVFDTHAPPALARHATTLGARSVLVLRELRPEALRAFATSSAATAFDRIVVPHDVGEMDLSPLHGAGIPTFLVGPIVRPMGDEPLPLNANPRVGKGTPRALSVVALAGGGGQPVDARRYVRAVADAHLLARVRYPRLETLLVTGPYGTKPKNAESYPGLAIVNSAPDLPTRMANAAVVVSQCGYNAIAEIRALGKPAVLVPGYRKSEDQSARARRLERVGAAVRARPEARAIADRLEALLGDEAARDAMREAHARNPLVPGNRRAAQAVLGPVWRPKREVEKVVLVAHDLAPRLGGMETVARALAVELLARGVEVRVYTTNRLGAGDPRATGLPEGVVVPLFRPLPRPGRIDLVADLHATLERALLDEPDVIHLCHAGLGPWIPTLRGALPAVVTANVHGNDLVAPWVSHGASEEEYRAARFAGLSAASAVVCVSHFSARLAAAHGVARTQVIENGVDVARFCPGARDLGLARRLGLRDDDEVLLTVSRLAPRKGHATVVRALARLAHSHPRLKYVFTGASDAAIEDLHALAHALGVGGRVVAAGFVDEAELPSLYRLARVFALLSEDVDDEGVDVEGFGVALLEAAATGVPQVGTRSGGIPEAIAENETGLLVAPGDVEGAAEAFARLLDAPALAEQLGRRARERVVTTFSQARACERIVTAWTALLPESTRVGGKTVHARLRTIEGNPAEITRAARVAGVAARASRIQRAETIRAQIARDRTVRVRATGEGERLLPEVLAAASAIGHRPVIEVKLRRFVDRDFLEHAVPLIAAVELAHGVPYAGADALLTTLRAIPESTLRCVTVVRLFLSHEARANAKLAASAAPEAHALRRFFSAHGAVVVPPPELMRYLSTSPAGGPETGMIEPTNLCNLACPTCPTGTGKIKPLPSMALSRFDDVLGQLAPRMRNLALWNYGEPLLNRELPSMIAHAKTAGVRVVKVSSNVHFLDGPRGEALLRSGLDVLILSVDGASQATYQTFRKDGDFEHVARSVAWLCAEKKRLALTKPRIELQFIAMRHNEHELPEMRRLAHEWGVDALRVKTVGADDEGSRGLVPASRLLSRYADDGTTPNTRHAFCTMAWDHTVVNVDGSVTPCCYLRPDMGESFVMGNVFETPFLSIWRGERYRTFRESMLAGRGNMPVCNTCRGGTHDLLAAVEEIAR